MDPSTDAESPGSIPASHLTPSSSTRCTTHYRDQGGLGYTMSVAWMHIRPFMPFLMISCLVVALIFVLQNIVYGGPFTDPLFFSRFEQRWPKLRLQTPTSHRSNQSVAI